MSNQKYASRAGEKLEFALKTFQMDVSGLVCADFGSSTGGFTDCLLQHGAKKVYAVETGYGLLDWKLRNDARVVVLERTNAVHVELPEQVDLITIDTSWTKQSAILPSAYKNLKADGRVISLVKLSFEVGGQSRKVKGQPKEEVDGGNYSGSHKKTASDTNCTDQIDSILEKVEQDIANSGFSAVQSTQSPILGAKGKNIEYLYLLKKG